MDLAVRLVDLATMHPRLLWEHVATATVAVLGRTASGPRARVELAVEELPGFGSDSLALDVDLTGIPSADVKQLQRTYEPSRLVELAAIAIAGIGLYYGGGHEIRDVALRGTGADYLVDESNHLLEIAGRSRHSDFRAAWRQRWQRLADRGTGGFYLCVVEFEIGTGRLTFQP